MSFQLNQDLVNDYHSDKAASTPIPEGEYTLVIVATEDNENRAGTGRYYKLECDVAEGDHKGRKLWEIVNYEHTNSTAQAIATRFLTGLCLALEMQGFTSPDELRFKPFRAMVKVDAGRGDYGPQNRIKRILAPKPAEQPVQARAPQAAAPAAPPQVSNPAAAQQQQGWQ